MASYQEKRMSQFGQKIIQKISLLKKGFMSNDTPETQPLRDVAVMEKAAHDMMHVPPGGQQELTEQQLDQIKMSDEREKKLEEILGSQEVVYQMNNIEGKVKLLSESEADQVINTLDQQLLKIIDSDSYMLMFGKYI